MSPFRGRRAFRRVPAESKRLIRIADAVWLLDVGATDARLHCLVAESPAGLILFEPQYDAIDSLIEAFTEADWRFADVIAIMATGSTNDGVLGAFGIGVRNRRSRLLLPKQLVSRLSVRVLRNGLDDDLSDDQLKAALARAESVSVFETAGPGGRAIEVLPAPDKHAVAYLDVASGIAFTGVRLGLFRGAVPVSPDLAGKVRSSLNGLRDRDVRLVVSPDLGPLAPDIFLAEWDSYVALRFDALAERGTPEDRSSDNLRL
jgi:hypothetical protein